MKPDPLLGEYCQRLFVDRRFGQPHPDGLAAEPGAEIPHAPADLGHLVAPREQRQDDVMVGHRHGVARSDARRDSRSPATMASRDFERVIVEPAEERRADVERTPRICVDHPYDAALRVE